MRFIFITLLLLSTPAAYAASPEECLNMARDYLAAVDKNQSDTQTVYARETFMSHCKTGNPVSLSRRSGPMPGRDRVGPALRKRSPIWCYAWRGRISPGATTEYKAHSPISGTSLHRTRSRIS